MTFAAPGGRVVVALDECGAARDLGLFRSLWRARNSDEADAKGSGFRPASGWSLTGQSCGSTQRRWQERIAEGGSA